MAEKEYIERAPFIKDLTAMKREYDAISIDGMIKALATAPAADVAPVVHARWITEENTEGYRGDPHCTACKGILDDEAVYGHTPGVDSFFYCPFCGAKMDGGKETAP